KTMTKKSQREDERGSKKLRRKGGCRALDSHTCVFPRLWQTLCGSQAHSGTGQICLFATSNTANPPHTHIMPLCDFEQFPLLNMYCVECLSHTNTHTQTHTHTHTTHTLTHTHTHTYTQTHTLIYTHTFTHTSVCVCVA